MVISKIKPSLTALLVFSVVPFGENIKTVMALFVEKV